MKLTQTLIFLLTGFMAHAQIIQKTFYDIRKTKPNEVYYINSSGQYNGIFTKYDIDGAKAVEINFTNGLKNGSGKEYYTRDGKSKLKIAATYKDDEKHGHWITYTYVKDGISYYDLMQDISYNSSAKSVFNEGAQIKYKEEFFDNGNITKEILYHITGKPFYIANFNERRYVGEYVCYNEKNVIIAKGKIGPEGKMIGTWIVPRENNGMSPKNKHEISNVTYTQKIKFDDEGNLDTSYISKSYYLSGKLKDSVRLVSLKNQSGYDWNGIWFLCGPNDLERGDYREFYESGKIKTEGRYGILNGKKVKLGVWKTFDESGAISDEVDEDAIRMEAEEAQKEALRKKQEEERKEQERIEKERIEKEEAQKEAERLKKEKLEKEKAEQEAKRLEREKMNQLIAQADSSVANEKKLYDEFESISVTKQTTEPRFGKYTVENATTHYLYVISKKPDFYPHCKEIHNSFLTKVEALKKEDYNNKFYGKTAESIKLNTDLISLSEKHAELNKKMTLLAGKKTSKLEKLLKEAKNVEEKIQIITDYQIEP